ncbi:MAG TPA: helix-turn-helix domain-containing protein [Caldilineaceae bacterium]|nr:helix-turn-helix domain-containing protein [Caldilineaceae bacterium]
MIYVRTLNQEEEVELRRMTRHEVGRVSQRAQMILLSAQRRTVPEISAIFAVSRATVRYWIEQFEAQGPAGLYDDPRAGRPRKAITKDKAKVVKRFTQTPLESIAILIFFWTATRWPILKTAAWMHR